MQIIVSVEPNNDQGFTAQTPLAPGLTAAAPTVEQAVSQLQEQLTSLAAGGGLVQIEVQVPTGKVVAEKNPWQEIHGIYRDDPLFAEVQEHMRAYREERNLEMDNIED